jgi:hypothetical protein
MAVHIVESGFVSRGVPGTARAVLGFPGLTQLDDGSILATCRAGTTKDSDDETVEVHRSFDGGRTWTGPAPRFGALRIGGRLGSLKVCYVTQLAPRRLLGAALWVDRESYPGKPLFNAETEGCLPMAVLLAESPDSGRSWSGWRRVDMPPEIGPPSLTNPVLRLGDGRLALSIETNKAWEDRSKWFQRVVLFHSADEGRSWTGPVTAGVDPTGRIFNWDQRAAVTPDGRIAAFLWTYDSESRRYLDVHRRMSRDHGATWGPAEALGFADQPSHPAILPDGRTVIAWVDRFGSRSIRARLAPDAAGTFDPATEVVVYSHDAAAGFRPGVESTGTLLSDMSLWSFGLAYAEALADGDVMVLYYAGSPAAMDVRWARLRP